MQWTVPSTSSEVPILIMVAVSASVTEDFRKIKPPSLPLWRKAPVGSEQHRRRGLSGSKWRTPHSGARFRSATVALTEQHLHIVKASFTFNKLAAEPLQHRKLLLGLLDHPQKRPIWGIQNLREGSNLHLRGLKMYEHKYSAAQTQCNRWTWKA